MIGSTEMLCLKVWDSHRNFAYCKNPALATTKPFAPFKLANLNFLISSAEPK
ncbi:MAG: hypothetical protein KKE05_07120 [Nanoarchaeota archaeon]|nr:hypothetical protein [Nanoarchaeota archaeon]